MSLTDLHFRIPLILSYALRLYNGCTEIIASSEAQQLLVVGKQDTGDGEGT